VHAPHLTVDRPGHGLRAGTTDKECWDRSAGNKDGLSGASGAAGESLLRQRLLVCL